MEMKWIPVKDKLPEPQHNYLVTAQDGVVTTAFYCGSWQGRYESAPVAAWMPIPEPYKEPDPIKLLPCPFCGGKAIIFTGYKCYVACPNKDCRMSHNYDSIEEAVSAWNTRKAE